MEDKKIIDRNGRLNIYLLFLLKDSKFRIKKPSKKLKGFNIVVIQKLLSEFFVFVHELINSTSLSTNLTLPV
jgi:hypothetical protein